MEDLTVDHLLALFDTEVLAVSIRKRGGFYIVSPGGIDDKLKTEDELAKGMWNGWQLKARKQFVAAVRAYLYWQEIDDHEIRNLTSRQRRDLGIVGDADPTERVRWHDHEKIFKVIDFRADDQLHASHSSSRPFLHRYGGTPQQSLSERREPATQWTEKPEPHTGQITILSAFCHRRDDIPADSPVRYGSFFVN